LPQTEGVVLTGWVGDETLPGLLAAADVFAYPSLYEGFGLPPLEAMAAGTASLVGNYSAAPEVVGDGALIVDASGPSAIAEGLVELMQNEQTRRSYVLAGRTRAAQFTWGKTAKLTIAAYEKAVATR
jgi:glycosyltransferase involved in cell wall biosynthesis